jgi:hypothetical protein
MKDFKKIGNIELNDREFYEDTARIISVDDIEFMMIRNRNDRFEIFYRTKHEVCPRCQCCGSKRTEYNDLQEDPTGNYVCSVCFEGDGSK